MEQKDPPIEPQDFIHGMKVIDIGDYRVSRGFSRRESSLCPHINLVYDQAERRIWCKDCEKNVEGFDAFLLLAKNFSKQSEKLFDRENKVSEAEKHSLISIAAKVLDEAWRAKKMIPCCPHCKEGLFPEDFKNGCGFLGKSYALERQRRIKQKKK